MFGKKVALDERTLLGKEVLRMEKKRKKILNRDADSDDSDEEEIEQEEFDDRALSILFKKGVIEGSIQLSEAQRSKLKRWRIHRNNRGDQRVRKDINLDRYGKIRYSFGLLRLFVKIQSVVYQPHYICSNGDVIVLPTPFCLSFLLSFSRALCGKVGYEHGVAKRLFDGASEGYTMETGKEIASKKMIKRIYEEMSNSAKAFELLRHYQEGINLNEICLFSKGSNFNLYSKNQENGIFTGKAVTGNRIPALKIVKWRNVDIDRFNGFGLSTDFTHQKTSIDGVGFDLDNGRNIMANPSLFLALTGIVEDVFEEKFDDLLELLNSRSVKVAEGSGKVGLFFLLTKQGRKKMINREFLTRRLRRLQKIHYLDKDAAQHGLRRGTFETYVAAMLLRIVRFVFEEIKEYVLMRLKRFCDEYPSIPKSLIGEEYDRVLGGQTSEVRRNLKENMELRVKELNRKFEVKNYTTMMKKKKSKVEEEEDGEDDTDEEEIEEKLSSNLQKMYENIEADQEFRRGNMSLPKEYLTDDGAERSIEWRSSVVYSSL